MSNHFSYKAGIIGLGPHGHRVLEALSALENVQVAAIVDRRDEALASPKIPTATVRCRSLDQLWAVGAIDLVCIATNGPSHAPLAIEAMNQGVRHLMIAKPMACSLAECNQILELAARTGTRVAVDHIRRHAPVYVWLRQRILSGDWGSVRCIWTQRPGIGLGCLATHSFDAVRFLTGLEARRVTGWIDEPIGKNPRGGEFVDPGGLVVMELGHHVRAVVSQIEDGAGPASIEIDLTGGRVRLDEKSGEIEVVERDLSVIPGPGRPAVYRRAELPAGLTAKVDMHDGLIAMLSQLLSDQPLNCEGVHGRASVEMLAAAHLSHRSGHVPIAVPNDHEELTQLWLPVT
jgi:predicted dehydrogenase